jgi:hypothetical protein
VAWVIFLLLGMVILRQRRIIRSLRRRLVAPAKTRPGPSGALSRRAFQNLVLLRHELSRLHDQDRLAESDWKRWCAKLDDLVLTGLEEPAEEEWSRRRDEAWSLLSTHLPEVPSRPPWHPEDQEPAGTPAVPSAVPPPGLPVAHARTVEPEEATRPVGEPISSHTEPRAPEVPREGARAQERALLPSFVPRPAQARGEAAVGTQSPDAAAHSAPALAREAPTPRPGYAFQPKEPSALEQALAIVSGWPKLFVPFLVQNLGWFIGSFLFVAGSVFLVTYTSGFAKSLTIYATLSLYSLFLIGSGYQLRRRRPELSVSSTMLFALGAFLIPLDLSAAARMIESGIPGVPTVAGALLATALGLIVFFFAMRLASGVMDRSLQGEHPRIFLALAAVQLLLPLLHILPTWHLVALAHVALLLGLAYGVWRLSHDWLEAIFAERRTIAYYAAGTLIYAAVVSFVHITWGTSESVVLPSGYFGPFVMALAAVLSHLDSSLKQWTARYAFLSSFSFLVYGISVLALILSLGQPTTRVITLALGMLLYGGMIRRYLTLSPLYLWIISGAWLYSELVLAHLPAEWSFLAGAPGLAGLLWLAARLGKERSRRLIRVAYMSSLFLGGLLLAWTLLKSEPGLLAFATVLAATALAYYTIVVRSLEWLGAQAEGTEPEQDSGDTAWLYLITLGAMLAAFYAPAWLALGQAVQLVLSLNLLAAGWIRFGLHARTDQRPVRAEVFLNSALVFLLVGGLVDAACFFGVTCTRMGTLDAVPQILILGSLGALLVWLAIGVRGRALLYGGLVALALGAALIKHYFFPGPSTGTGEALASLGIWGLLWWLARRSSGLPARPDPQSRPTPQSIRLIWLVQIPDRAVHIQDFLRGPLGQAMALLVTICVFRLAENMLEARVGPQWAATATLATLASALLAAHFRLRLLTPAIVSLGLGAWLGFGWLLGLDSLLGFVDAAILYALLAWLAAAYGLPRPATWRVLQFLRLASETRTPIAFSPVERLIHHTSFVVVVLCLLFVMTVGALVPRLPGTELSHALLSLLAGGLFFAAAGWHRRSPLHTYLLLVAAFIASLLIWAAVGAFVPLAQLANPSLGLLAVLLGLGYTLCGWWQRSARSEADTLIELLYERPLQFTALGLGLIAVSQQLSIVALATSAAGSGLPAMVLAAAGLLILGANHALRLPTATPLAVLTLVLTALWVQDLWLRGIIGLIPWPAPSTPSDLWVTLGALSLALPSLALANVGRYAGALRRIAGILFGWALLGSAATFLNRPDEVGLFCVFLLLAVALLPLLVDRAWAPQLRGPGIAFLLTWALWTVLESLGHTLWLAPTTAAWGFGLWTAAVFAWPRWNARWPRWAVSPRTWPWIGLATVGVHVWGSMSATAWRPLLTATLYLLLMLPFGAAFRWLAAPALAVTGVALLAWWFEPDLQLPPHWPQGPTLGFALGSLIWANLLLLLARIWRGETSRFERFIEATRGLASPLEYSASALLALWLAPCVFAAIGLMLEPSPHIPAPWSILPLLGIVLTASTLHWLWLQPTLPRSHVLIAVILAVILSTAGAFGVTRAYLTLVLAVFAAGLRVVQRALEQQQGKGRASLVLFQALDVWVQALAVGGAIAMLVVPDAPPFFGQVLAGAVLAGLALDLGWHQGRRIWLGTGYWLLVILVHLLPLLWTLPEERVSLLSWYTLTMASTAWGLLWGRKILTNHLETRPPDQNLTSQRLQRLKAVLRLCVAPTAALALLEWTACAYLAVLGAPARYPATLGQGGAACLAAGLLIALGIREARRTQASPWIYGTVVLTLAAGLYTRVLLFAAAPVTVWDTAALLGAALLVLVAFRNAPSPALFRVLLLLPLLALLTVPLQLASVHSTLALLGAGALYVALAQTSRRLVPRYLALLSATAAVYVWAPAWAGGYGLVQPYLIPASISVLVLLHIHRRELRKSVLNGTRLAALTVLYTGATLDVFLRPELGIFVLVLALSLVGIALGIALRIRAFLYSGMAFLALNIAGQMIHRFPEALLAKALILMLLGTAITAGMVWFNMKREAILGRLRIYRADLATWQ